MDILKIRISRMTADKLEAHVSTVHDAWNQADVDACMAAAGISLKLMYEARKGTLTPDEINNLRIFVNGLNRYAAGWESYLDRVEAVMAGTHEEAVATVRDLRLRVEALIGGE